MQPSPDLLVILDRDGVINEDSDLYIKSPDEWHAVPGSLAAIGRLKSAGYRVAVSTNQSGLGRGLFDEFGLARIHEKMQRQLTLFAEAPIDLIVWCPHLPDAGCDCRKPSPGLLLQIARELGASLAGVWYIGDSLKDLQAAVAVGAQPVLVLSGKGQSTLDQGNLPQNTLVFVDLSAAVDALLAKTSLSTG